MKTEKNMKMNMIFGRRLFACIVSAVMAVFLVPT